LNSCFLKIRYVICGFVAVVVVQVKKLPALCQRIWSATITSFETCPACVQGGLNMQDMPKACHNSCNDKEPVRRANRSWYQAALQPRWNEATSIPGVSHWYESRHGWTCCDNSLVEIEKEKAYVSVWRMSSLSLSPSEDVGDAINVSTNEAKEVAIR